MVKKQALSHDTHSRKIKHITEKKPIRSHSKGIKLANYEMSDIFLSYNASSCSFKLFKNKHPMNTTTIGIEFLNVPIHISN